MRGIIYLLMAISFLATGCGSDKDTASITATRTNMPGTAPNTTPGTTNPDTTVPAADSSVFTKGAIHNEDPTLFPDSIADKQGAFQYKIEGLMYTDYIDEAGTVSGSTNSSDGTGARFGGLVNLLGSATAGYTVNQATSDLAVVIWHSNSINTDIPAFVTREGITTGTLQKQENYYVANLKFENEYRAMFFSGYVVYDQASNRNVFYGSFSYQNYKDIENQQPESDSGMAFTIDACDLFTGLDLCSQ